jgi:hypothetical protein
MLDDGREYYAVFSEAKKHGLWWLDKQFQHCFIVRKDYGRIWTVIEDSYNHLQVHPFLVEEYPNLSDLVGEQAIILPVKREIKDRFRGTLCLFNCVEVAKAVLGIRKTFIFTPKQLYRYLHEQNT